MSLSTGTIIEVQNGGSDSNGGGFNPNNANFATDLAATSATGSSPVVTSASYTFVAGDVGAKVFVKSGTNWTPGWYAIASVAAGAATLTASIGSAVLYSAAPSIPANGLNTVAGCATTASPTGGTWGLDYSVQTAPGATFTDMIIDPATNTKFTSVLTPVGKNMVGNLISVTSGTGFTVQVVEVISTSTITATCDKSLGTLASTGGNGLLGGALATPGRAGFLVTAGAGTGGGNTSIIFIKYNASAYSCTSSSNVAGGRLTTVGNSIVGYNTTRTMFNSDALRPTINAASASMSPITLSGTYATIRNINVSGNGQASVTGITLSIYEAIAKYCSVDACATGFNVGNGSFSALAMDCVASNCTVKGFDCQYYGTTCLRCTVTGLTGTAIGFNNDSGAHGVVWQECLVIGTGAGGASGLRGFSTNKITRISNCTAYGIGSVGQGHGFVVGGSENAYISNCLAYACADTGFVLDAGDAAGIIMMENCAVGACGTATSGWKTNQVGLVTLSVDPFTNAAGNDFSINGTAGGGALVRGAGLPATFFGLATTPSYRDIGADQTLGTGTSTDPGIANVLAGVNYQINGASLTGILVAGSGTSAYRSSRRTTGM